MLKISLLSKAAICLLTPVLFCVFIFTAHVIASADLPDDIIVVDTFASSVVRENLPEGWKPLVFSPMKPNTRYDDIVMKKVAL